MTTADRQDLAIRLRNLSRNTNTTERNARLLALAAGYLESGWLKDAESCIARGYIIEDLRHLASDLRIRRAPTAARVVTTVALQLEHDNRSAEA